ncbi:MAG: DUF3418 domain-containing protein [Tepidisphaerales bacterium]
MPLRTALPRDEAARRDAIHRALLTGLLGNVGRKTDKPEYLGPRAVKFHLFPGSALFKAKPPWVMAAELVETTRLYARTVAPIRPEWIEAVAPHLLSKSFGDPRWDARGGRAMTDMRLSYQGLVVVPARAVPFAKVDTKGARNLFIHHALVEGDVAPPLAHARFLRHNLELVEQVRRLEEKARRRDLLADAVRLFAFYDARVPPDVADAPSFEKWRRSAEAADPKLLWMSRQDVLAGDDADITAANYPDEFIVPGSLDPATRSGPIRLALRYRFDPSHPGDGVTAIVPLDVLASLSAWQFDRLVPGYLLEKIDALIRSLPKGLRVKFVPVPQFAAQALPACRTPRGPLVEALGRFLQVSPDSFDPASLPRHLHFNFRVVDASGKVLAVGRDLAKLRTELGIKTRSVFAELPPGEWNRDGLTRWDFGELPEKVEVNLGGAVLPAYPALVDRGETVSLRLMESPETAYETTRGGLRRLFALQLREEMKYLEKNIPGFDRMALYYRPIGTADDLKADLLAAASERALVTEPEQIRTRQQFIDHAREGWRLIVPAMADIANVALAVLETRHRLEQTLSRVWPELLLPSVRDVQEQLAALMPRRFLSLTPQAWLPHLPRFLKAAEVRLSKLLNAGAARDLANLKIIRPLWQQYLERARAHAQQHIRDPELVQYRWMLEELRVSLFAQELKTSIPVSPQRLEKQWERVRPAR